MKKIVLLFALSLAVHSITLAQTSVTMDARVLKHYTPEQLKEIETTYPQKLKSLNFYYSSSFVVLPGATGGTVDPATIDITEFEHLRQEDKRITTGVSRANGAMIELLSRKELQAKYKELAASK